ncbi:MAG: response regulator transcription factor [Hyphomicrobiales bacterium]|nr:MAG: response regulator transcription factor [Hyphomicrobiales bacterium]
MVLGVAFDLTDPALEQVLRTLIAGRHDLYEADAEEAAVTITDRPAALGGVTGAHRVLRVGADEARRNAIDSLDPGLILAAALLIGAGYALERETVERTGNERLPASLLPRLSQRERQVAELLVDGASNKVIARALDISVHTAKFHVTAILEKLGARNRADAVSIILREGLVAI